MGADDLVWQDAIGLARLIPEGTVSAVEVVAAHLDRIEAVGDRVNAFVTVLGEQALHAAARPASGPLGGVPFTVKDSFGTAGVRTTRGSRLFADRVPESDATPVARLRQAGGILLAKTNLPEMSYWTETDNHVAGRSLNPYDPQRTPGGSSGGESAAIASGLSPLGIGSDVAIRARARRRHRDRLDQAHPRQGADDRPLPRRTAPLVAHGPHGPQRARPAPGPVPHGRTRRRRPLHRRTGRRSERGIGDLGTGVVAVRGASTLVTCTLVVPTSTDRSRARCARRAAGTS